MTSTRKTVREPSTSARPSRQSSSSEPPAERAPTLRIPPPEDDDRVDELVRQVASMAKELADLRTELAVVRALASRRVDSMPYRGLRREDE